MLGGSTHSKQVDAQVNTIRIQDHVQVHLVVMQLEFVAVSVTQRLQAARSEVKLITLNHLACAQPSDLLAKPVQSNDGKLVVCCTLASLGEFVLVCEIGERQPVHFLQNR